MTQDQILDNHKDIADIITSLMALLERNIQVGFRQDIVLEQIIRYKDIFNNLYIALYPYIQGSPQTQKQELDSHFEQLLVLTSRSFIVETYDTPHPNPARLIIPRNIEH